MSAQPLWNGHSVPRIYQPYFLEIATLFDLCNRNTSVSKPYISKKFLAEGPGIEPGHEYYPMTD